MADINNFPDVPGYLSIKQAAELLGITDKRVYRYIDLGRLPAFKSGGIFLLSEEDVKQFKLNPPGRLRAGPPPWKVYNSRSKVLATDIHVHVRTGQQNKLMKTLKTIQEKNLHHFPGTIARYIIKGNASLETIQIMLIWKDTDVLNEDTLQQKLQSFKEELADMLDWNTAQYNTNEVIIYT